MSFWNFWTWLTAYYAIGLGFHLFVPKPPGAKAAFDAAEKAHPMGFVLCAFIVATGWPLIAFGLLLRFLRGGR